MLAPEQSTQGRLDEAGQITARSVIVGLGFSIVFSFIIPYVDVFLSSTFLGAQHLPPGAVFALLFLVVVVNPLLRVLGRHAQFTRVELLMIYCMLLFSTLVPGHGAENVFIPVSASAYYYASPENKWDELFLHLAPTWFAPQDERAITTFFEGLRPGEKLPWSQWYTPLAVWGLFSAILYALVLFLSIIFRRQWADREKLSFPLVALPMEMTADCEHPFRNKAFFGNRVMWVGFGVAALLQLQNGLGFYYPGFPSLKLTYNFQQAFREPPWNAVGWVPGHIWLVVIGVTVLLRTEVSFSLWFFFWFTKLQRIIAEALGFRGHQQPTTWGEPGWLGMQPVGGYIAYVALSFWVARNHLRDVWEEATGGRVSSQGEPLSYRVCVIGIACCLVALLWWCMAAGMSAPVALGQMVVYIILAMALTKVVAESGMLFVQATLSSLETMITVVGTEGIGARNLTVGMFIERSFMTDLRAFLMPSFMQSLKIADLANMSKRRMLAAFGATIFISTIICYWANLKIVYTYSGMACNSWFVQGAGPGGFRLLQNFLMAPREPSITNTLSMIVGGSFTLLLFHLRQRFVWFPFHPVGFIYDADVPDEDAVVLDVHRVGAQVGHHALRRSEGSRRRDPLLPGSGFRRHLHDGGLADRGCNHGDAQPLPDAGVVGAVCEVIWSGAHWSRTAGPMRRCRFAVVAAGLQPAAVVRRGRMRAPIPPKADRAQASDPGRCRRLAPTGWQLVATSGNWWNRHHDPRQP